MTLVVIDGLDASGKSTQSSLLSKYLSSLGKTVCVRAHPSDDSFFGLEARRFLQSSGKSAHFASSLFFMFDVIRSVLLYSWRGYDYLIFVRYLMGTAYLPSPLHKFAYGFFALLMPRSEAMYFLDISPEVAVKRINENRRVVEMFEDINSLRRVRSKALFLASLGRWHIVNGDRDPTEIEAEIVKSI